MSCCSCLRCCTSGSKDIESGDTIGSPQNVLEINTLDGEKIEVPITGSLFEVRARIAHLRNVHELQVALMQGERRLGVEDLRRPACKITGPLTMIVNASPTEPADEPEEPCFKR